MKESISVMAYRLANGFGHGWANVIPISSEWDREVPGVVLEEIVHWMNQDETTVGPGIYPANSHITRTGRVSWGPMTWYSDWEYHVSIHRSDTVVGGLGGGSITVLRACMSMSPSGLIVDIHLDSTRLAEQRHWRELLVCLQLLGLQDCDTPNSDSAWDQSICGCLGQSTVRHYEWNELTAQVDAGLIPNVDPIGVSYVED